MGINKTININGAGMSAFQVTESINENVDNRDLIPRSELPEVVKDNQDTAVLSFAGASSEAVDIRVTTGAVTSDIALGGTDPVGGTAGLLIVADKEKIDKIPEKEVLNIVIPATIDNRYFKIGEMVATGAYQWLNFKVVIESRICSAEFFVSVASRADLTIITLDVKGYAVGTSAFAITHDSSGNINLYMLLRSWSPSKRMVLTETSKHAWVNYSLAVDSTPHLSDGFGTVAPVDGNLSFVFRPIE